VNFDTRSAIFLVLAVCTGGCANIPDRRPLPLDQADAAQIPGIEYARQWADEPPQSVENWMSLPPAVIREQFPAAYASRHNYLALSGGGSNGAFGAGLLTGWTIAGDRPEFLIVTGVSTGALIAPFAFLGPGYDDDLRAVYTEIDTDDILKFRKPVAALSGDAVATAAPLRHLVATYINGDMIAEIAEEHAKGRRLIVVTTNIDASRPVAWNIGEIAASDSPIRVELIHDVLVASASVPVAFPPVMFEVEANGQRYDEMHVDGGVESQVYLYPLGLDWSKLIERLEVKSSPNVYIIRNGFLEDEPKIIDRDVFSIGVRAIDTMMTNVVSADLYRIFIETKRDGLNFQLSHVPDSFDMQSDEIFDREYMNALFELGYQMAVEGIDWQSSPPGYDTNKSE